MLDRYDQELLLDYLEGELDADRRAQLQAILAQDQQLATLLNAMARDRAALRSIPQVDAPTDLLQDLTQSLERRMLLDDQAVDIGPIPIGRGRELHSQTSSGPRWGRVAGLSALAASVALAAGIVVITMDKEFDPLMRTAEKLADASEASQAPESADKNVPLSTAAVAQSQPGSSGPTNSALAKSGESNPLRPSTSGTVGGNEPGQAERSSRSLIAEGLRDFIAGSKPEDSATGSFVRETDTQGRARNLQSQAPVALTVDEPSVQLVLFSIKPELTSEQLISYCVANGIPIVQANLSANGSINANTTDQAKDADPAEMIDQLQYALLVDEQALDQLVSSLNTNLAADDQGNVQRDVIFSQAAVVSRLTRATESALLRQSAPQQARAFAADAADGANESKALNEETAPSPATTVNVSPVPIPLELPADLGSNFANTRNRENLLAQQQRSAYGNSLQQATNEPDQPTEPVAQADQLPAEPQAVAKGGLEGAGHPAADVAPEGVADVPPPPLTEQAGAIADDAAPNLLVVGPDPSDAKQDQVNREPIGTQPLPTPTDANRGNWLSPYLPLANTTQILNWRQTDTRPAPRLVPIVIQLAPTEQVNALRLEQQANQARRQSEPQAKQPTETDDAKAQQQEAAPAEAITPQDQDSEAK